MPDRVHRIRLIGPWEVAGPLEWPPTFTPGPSRRVTVPADWRTLFGDSGGIASFRRSFHTPTNLGPGDRVLLELPPESGDLIAAELNGAAVSIPANAPWRLDLSDLLDEFNTLTLQIKFHPADHPDQPGGLWQPVVLAIESAAN